MKVTVTGISPHPQGLRLGLTLQHEKAGWIRFAATVLVVQDLNQEERKTLVGALNKAIDDYLDTEVDPVLF